MRNKIEIKNFSQNKIKENLKEMESNNELKKSYKSLVKSLGALVLQNGLYASIVFIISKTKDKNNYYYVLKDIQKFLKEYFKDSYVVNNKDIKDIKQEVLEFLESESFKKAYKQFSEQFIEFIKWHRRYVDIYIDID
ncbi:cmr CRISPR-associated protein, Cmr5 family [Thermosipho africanus Ob7]|jgi:CRISPR-associated protein Cmr5|uniref:type III-B CRISPR module-associated protein Cmr5 n=1 Tax=Thermosipho TaxID=2420 RepID=UPI000E0ABFBC|nr:MULTISPECIES: type III-B CRISPR module-associated protein Cmr5 [Thermosipho]MBZ4649364.1 cmr crispr-associated protein Cmr5 family [Thermosipho sp. (in: thermotogales)]RDI92680.1 cmr CRISPR-associated protein, Cmr5 family [Thermosipho africanus Ob7]